MELVNECYLYRQNVAEAEQNSDLLNEIMPTLVKLIAPFAPHMAEELWALLGQAYSIFDEKWPEHDESFLVEDIVNLGVQVNGKIRGQIRVNASADNEEIIAIALKNDKKIDCCSK